MGVSLLEVLPIPQMAIARIPARGTGNWPVLMVGNYAARWNLGQLIERLVTAELMRSELGQPFGFQPGCRAAEGIGAVTVAFEQMSGLRHRSRSPVRDRARGRRQARADCVVETIVVRAFASRQITLIPAQARIQPWSKHLWIPAFAGMSGRYYRISCLLGLNLATSIMRAPFRQHAFARPRPRTAQGRARSPGSS